MSDLTPEDRALLHLARGGHDPGPADRDRIRGAIAAQLGIAASLVSSSAGAVGGASAGGGVLSAAGLAVVKIIGAAVIVVSVGAGTTAVYRALRTAPAATAPSAGAEAPVLVVPAPAAERGVPATPATAAMVPATPATRAVAAIPSPVAAAPVEATTRPARSHPAANVDRTPAAPTRVRETDRAETPELAPLAPVAMAPADTAPVSSLSPTSLRAEMAPADTAPVSSLSPTSLRAETELIRAGLAALHAADPARALALFDRHERDYPTGVLADERDVERITALCDLGRRADARSAASSFLRRRASSPLAARVLSSCGGPSRPIP